MPPLHQVGTTPCSSLPDRYTEGERETKRGNERRNERGNERRSDRGSERHTRHRQGRIECRAVSKLALLHYSIPHFSKTYYGNKKFLFPTRTTSGHRVVIFAVVVPPWLSSESEDDEPSTQKLEVDACVMAMENIYLQRSKCEPQART